MARPVKEIDKEQFEKLCAMQCTQNEICDFFSITDKTLVSWCKRIYGESYSDVYKQKRGLGKVSLRRMQFKLAEKNAGMAIWLGKQYLGQRDESWNHNDGEAPSVVITGLVLSDDGNTSS